MKSFNSKLLLIFVTLAVAGAFMSTGIYAGTKVDDVISMENAAYKHKKAIVKFTHKKHNEEYKVGCGDCHHDENNKPLELKAGDDVKGCIECHKNPGKAPAKDDAGNKLTDKQKREYHADAIHDNCIECHKADNKKKPADKPGTAPTKCTECHPKEGK